MVRNLPLFSFDLFGEAPDKMLLEEL